jgi:DNA repair exonuclease SbcCD ATPase subunit
MNLLLKDKISANKSAVVDNSYQIEILKSKIESAEEHNESIRKIKETEVNKIRERMQEHITKIENEKIKIENLEEEISNLIQTINDKQSIKNKISSAKNVKSELELNLKNLLKDVDFYHDHDMCPTCKQGIDHNFKDAIVNEKTSKRNELEEGILTLSEKINKYEIRLEEISHVEDNIQKRNIQIGEHKAQIKISKNSLLSYKNDLINAEKEVEEVDTSKLKEHYANLKKLNKEQTKLYEERETFGVVGAMLKDGGIKTRIIRQYIPVMNKLINKYLAAFDLFVDFQLDENFNETIKSRFRDTFTYSSFSEGEKLRITLSIMLAWRSVAKLRNSVSTNLLILDETLDGALDGVGIENLIDTLHNLNAGDNIFVISHRGDMFSDKFQSHIKFQKVKNFSQLAA